MEVSNERGETNVDNDRRCRSLQQIRDANELLAPEPKSCWNDRKLALLTDFMPSPVCTRASAGHPRLLQIIELDFILVPGCL